MKFCEKIGSAKWVAVALLISFIGGCSQLEVDMAPDSGNFSPAEGLARIVFIRSTLFNNKDTAAVFHVSDPGLHFIGVLNNDTRISFDVTPGKQAFMVSSMTVDYMRANLKAGATYYAIVAPGIGSTTRQFSLWPVRKGMGGEYFTDSSDFSYWLSNTVPVKNNERSLNWYDKNRVRLEEMHQKLWPAWDKGKTTYELDQKTLHPGDGME